MSPYAISCLSMAVSSELVQNQIRHVTRILMGRDSADDPFSKEHMASDFEVVAYDPEEGPACTAQDFRPDLADNQDSAWNTSVTDVFVQYYSSIHPEADTSTVRRLFQGHLKYLGNQYKQSADGIQALESRQRALNAADRRRAVSLNCVLLPAN